MTLLETLNAARHARVIVLCLSFHCSDKGHGDALWVDAPPEAMLQSTSRMDGGYGQWEFFAKHLLLC